MRLTAHMLALVFLASCQTPPPPRETFDDQVIVKDEPTPTPVPDAGSEPDAAVEVAVEPPVEPADKQTPPALETFVAKPELPPNMSFQEMALARTAQQVRMGLIFAPILDAGCGIPAAIRATADVHGAGYTVDSCSLAVDAIHALTYQRTITKVGVLDISPVSIRHDGEPIWSAATDCTALRQQDNACGSDFITRRPTAMSFVGPLLSYHLATNSAVAGGTANRDNQGVALDVRTGLPAKFGALIDDDSLLNGLKRDLTMRRSVNPTALDAAKTVAAVWKLWRTEDFAFFGGYYFGAWDAENGLVAMHIWYLEDDAAMSENVLKELVVAVMPKAQWKSAFEDAASESSGFLAP